MHERSCGLGVLEDQNGDKDEDHDDAGEQCGTKC